ncbi:MAG: hypothetical protein M0015_06015 [Betaproteobacteria bacterium]|nr:hypothetical protein [Betaproteobacteria bacterium]
MSGARSRRIELSPSRALTGAILLVHGLGAACVAAALPAPWGGVLGSALFALGLAAAWDRALLRGARAVRAIEPTGADEATIELRNGERFSTRVAGRGSVNRFWVALPVRLRARRTLFVTADMLEPETFRTLRLWALWGRMPGVARAPHSA